MYKKTPISMKKDGNMLYSSGKYGDLWQYYHLHWCSFRSLRIEIEKVYAYTSLMRILNPST